jgi:hypothetical protein
VKLTPIVKIMNQSRNFRRVLKSADIEAMRGESEILFPCIVRIATPAERIKYGIQGGTVVE